MNISIGGRPLSKIAWSLGSAVLVAVVVALLAVGPGVLDLGGREIVALIIAAAAPPLVAFVKHLAPKDIVQILSSIPPNVLQQYIDAARKHGIDLNPPGALAATPPATPPSPGAHEPPY